MNKHSWEEEETSSSCSTVQQRRSGRNHPTGGAEEYKKYRMRRKKGGEQLGRLFLSLVLLFFCTGTEKNAWESPALLYPLLLTSAPPLHDSSFILSKLLDFQCIKTFLLPLKKSGIRFWNYAKVKKKGNFSYNGTFLDSAILKAGNRRSVSGVWRKPNVVFVRLDSFFKLKDAAEASNF